MPERQIGITAKLLLRRLNDYFAYETVLINFVGYANIPWRPPNVFLVIWISHNWGRHYSRFINFRYKFIRIIVIPNLDGKIYDPFNIWRPPSPSVFSPYQISLELDHFGSEASIYCRYSNQRFWNHKNLTFIFDSIFLTFPYKNFGPHEKFHQN